MMLNIPNRDVLQSTFTNAAECRREGSGMLTRVRIEAEGSTPDEVDSILAAVSQAVSGGTADDASVVGHEQQALRDAQAGEFVIERFSKDLDGEPGHGAIFYRGRLTSHFARRYKELSLEGRSSTVSPYADA
jgi:hypothetical protein